jgi:hypothetical protein
VATHGDRERGDWCARFTNEVDYLVGPHYCVIKGDAHHAADETRCCAAHAFDVFRLPFEFERTRFARASAETHDAFVEVSLRLWRKPLSELTNRFVADQARIVIDGQRVRFAIDCGSHDTRWHLEEMAW